MELLQDTIARRSHQHPDKQAVTDGSNQLTYRDLEDHSNRLANLLKHHGVGRGAFVLLCMKRSSNVIAAILATLKADAVYVPLEVRTPPARRQLIVEDCRPQAVICDTDILDTMKSEGTIVKCGTAVLSVDEAGTLDTSRPASRNNSDDCACVLYTSGSTGRPKGVMISHGNIGSFADWAVEFIGIREDDRILGTAPLYFDMSLFDIFGALFAGATLCIATERTLLFPNTLLRFAEQEEVTVWKGVSSLLVYMAQTGSISKERLPSLGRVLFGGESLPTKYLLQWMDCFPDKTYFNAFGPTEATGVSMYYRVEKRPKRPDDKLSIGRPCENTQIYLVDGKTGIVPDGEVGEIVFGGPCITLGYLNDRKTTDAAYFENPWNDEGGRLYRTGDFAKQLEDGNYEFMGRRDDQIKYLGYRLELSDIEHAIISVSGVKGAGVLLAGSSETGLDELLGYVDLDGSRKVNEVLAELKARLPHFMLPKCLYAIEELPRTDRGKLDRLKLADYHKGRSKHDT